MNIEIKWFEGTYPSFNVILSSAAGKEPFLEVKGCKIMDGKNGAFVSWPSTKNQTTGKYWNHCYASDAFNAVVLSKAQESMPQKAPARPSRSGGGDDLDSVPF